MSARPTRVTVVTAFGTIGGSEHWILDVVRRSADVMAARFVVLQDGEFADLLRSEGYPVRVIATEGSLTASARAAWAVRRILKSDRPDVVVGNGVKAAAIAWPGCAQLRLPEVWVKHDHSFDAVLARRLAKRMSAVIATAAEVGAPTGREDLVVVEPPRPPDPLPADQSRDTLVAAGWSGEGPTVAMISRLVPYKGIDVAVRALAEAPGWTLLVIGGPDLSAPDEEQRLLALARDLGVAERVQLVGGIAGAGRTLACVDALAVLTRPEPGTNSPDREGYGIVADEAMLAGVPVIVAGEGPIASRLRTPDGAAGIVVPQSDPAATAAALRELADADVRRRMGAAGRTALAAHPDADEVARRVAGVIRSAS